MTALRFRAFAKFFICILIGAAFSSVVAFAWTGPTGIAPANNVAAPINTGATNQVKSGGLSVNSLVVFGNTLLSGFGAGVGRYLNFDYTAGGAHQARDGNGFFRRTILIAPSGEKRPISFTMVLVSVSLR